MKLTLGALWFSAYLGWHSFDADSRLGAVTDFLGGEHHAPDDGGLFGVRAAYPLAGRYAVETDWSILIADDQANADDDFPVIGLRVSGVADLTIDDATGGRLYALGGLGVRRSLGGVVPVADTELTFHAGVGARVALGDSWGVRLQGVLLTPDFGGVDYEVTAGGYWSLGD